MTNLRNTLLGTALIAVIATPALAAEGKKTKEIKEIVGYNVTEVETIKSPRSSFFKKMDRDGNGTVDFKEYQRKSNVDNEYEMFAFIDVNSDKVISLEEFATADVTKGRTRFSGDRDGYVKGTNIKTRPLPEVRSYYVPIEPEIVEIKDIN